MTKKKPVRLIPLSARVAPRGAADEPAKFFALSVGYQSERCESSEGPLGRKDYFQTMPDLQHEACHDWVGGGKVGP